ncbi:MAG: PAS domain S-box protein, partial [Bacteroidales bacterium]|nr:PAS domain S-box protein [Bacteroidales bacterium]
MVNKIISVDSDKIIDKFFRYSNELLFATDKDGIINRFNSLWEEQLGYNEHDLKGETINQLIHPDELKSIEDCYKDILTSPEKSNTSECRIKYKNGSYYWFEIKITNLLEDNDFKCILGSLHNISYQKQTNQDILDKDTIYNALFNNLSSSISVFDVITDSEGQPVDYKFVSVNSSYEQALNVKEADLLGKTLLEVYPRTEQVWLDAIKSVFVSGTPVTLIDYAQEVDIYYELIIYRPLKNMIALIGTDISENKRSEKKLRESENKFRGIIEGLNETCYRLNITSQTYEYISPSALEVFGYSHEEFISNPLLLKEIAHPDYKRYIQGEFDKLLRGEVTKNFEYKIIDPSGEERWIFQSNKGILDINGKLIAIEGLCRNITENKTAETEIFEKEAMFQTLFHNLTSAAVIFDVITDSKGTPVDYRYNSLNSAYEKQVGVESGQVIGQSLYKVFPNIEESWIRALNNVYFTGIPVHMEDYAEAVNKYFELVVYRPGKDMVALIGSDITQRRQDKLDILKAKEEVEEREMFLTQSQEIANIGSYKLNFKTKTWISTKTLDHINGIDSSYTKDLDHWFKLVYPGDKAMIEEFFINEIVAKKLPFDKEYRIVRLNDQQIRWIHVVGKHLLGDNGELSFLVGTIRDITKQKLAEQELILAKELAEESEYRLKALQNASLGGIAIHDKGVILDCNHGLSYITGYSYEELIGMDGIMLIEDDWREYVMNKIISGYEKPYEAYGIRKNGEVYPIRLEARNIPYQGKKARSVEFRDVSDIKKTEEALLEAKRKAEESDKLKTA